MLLGEVGVFEEVWATRHRPLKLIEIEVHRGMKRA
jgi:hypothetical protein